MNYIELIKSDNWKNKRQQILKRDNHECQRCGISKSNNFPGKIFKLGNNLEKNYTVNFFEEENLNTKLVSLIDQNGLEYICKSDIYNSTINRNQEYVITINYAKKNIIKYPFNGSTIDNQKPNIFLKKSTNEFLADMITDEDVTKNLEVDIEAFWLIEYGIENLSCKNGNKLEVHHKCYRKNQVIWNQDDCEYITLCNICHEIVHNNQLIPFYNEQGQIIQFMTPCLKCHGTGYLKQYNHISNGICFSCNGMGSLIDLKNW